MWLALAILAVALVVGWEEKRCQAHAYECQAEYATELRGVPIDQKAAEQQAITAACEPNGYFCRLFGPTNLPAMLLVIVGILAAWAALRTLRAIEGQTHVLAESQRPRIIAEASDDPSKTFADMSARRVKLRVTNKGVVPATGYRYESWIEVLPNHTGDFTDVADHHMEETISVLHPGFPHVANIPLRTNATEEESRQIARLERYVCVRLYIEYDDPFNPNRRCYSNFGFYLIPGGLGFLDKHNNVGYKANKRPEFE